jgi:hypothetical protein
MGTNYYLKAPRRCNAVVQICAWLQDIAAHTANPELGEQLFAVRTGILEGRAIKEPCPCDREPEGLHIGKASSGWCFSLRCYEHADPALEGYALDPTVGIKSLEAWIPLFQEHGVIDEYGHDVDLDLMLHCIRGRYWNHTRPLTESAAIEAGGAFDPETPLIRHRIDERHCKGWGPGTYDFCYGEFS